MRRLLMFAAAFALGSGAAANDNELDKPEAFSQDQIKHAEELPGTIVVRISKKDRKNVEVLFLKDRVAAGTKITAGAFEKMALNGEKVGVAYSPKNELDLTTSTSSWRVAFPGARIGFRAGFRRGYYGGCGYGGYSNHWASIGVCQCS